MEVSQYRWLIPWKIPSKRMNGSTPMTWETTKWSFGGMFNIWNYEIAGAFAFALKLKNHRCWLLKYRFLAKSPFPASCNCHFGRWRLHAWENLSFFFLFLFLFLLLLLLVVGSWLLAVSCWLLVVGCLLFIVGCLLLVVGCWLFVVGCLLLVVGCLLLLVVGCWLLV